MHEIARVQLLCSWSVLLGVEWAPRLFEIPWFQVEWKVLF